GRDRRERHHRVAQHGRFYARAATLPWWHGRRSVAAHAAWLAAGGGTPVRLHDTVGDVSAGPVPTCWPTRADQREVCRGLQRDEVNGQRDERAADCRSNGVRLVLGGEHGELPVEQRGAIAHRRSHPGAW